MRFSLDPKLYKKDKLYGATTVGSRGQVVIPVKARKDLGIKAGDQLLVIGKMGKLVALMKPERLSEIFEVILKMVAGTPQEKALKRHAEEVFGKNFNIKKKR